MNLKKSNPTMIFAQKRSMGKIDSFKQNLQIIITVNHRSKRLFQLDYILEILGILLRFLL